MKKMTIGLLTAAAVAAMPISASALTFKKGEVLGSDGQIYEGASPDIRARLIAKAQDGGKSAGVTGGQLYVVVRDKITDVLTKEALAAAGEDINLAEEAAEAASEAAAATKESMGKHQPGRPC